MSSSNLPIYRRILVATDGSKLSKVAARHAMLLARSTGAGLLAVHVVQPFPRRVYKLPPPLAAAEIERLERRWVEEGRLLADLLAADAHAAGVSAEGIVVQSDDVAQALITAAAEHGCDLIVMASHGHKGLARVLLGSETLQVLTRGTLPVLVLRGIESSDSSLEGVST